MQTERDSWSRPESAAGKILQPRGCAPCSGGTGTRRSASTFMPSAAPTARGQLAKPNSLPPMWPAPDSASSVESVPASGLLARQSIRFQKLYISTAILTPWLTFVLQVSAPRCRDSALTVQMSLHILHLCVALSTISNNQFIHTRSLLSSKAQ